MSYCVHCGVELDAAARSCALCRTPVYNPCHPVDDTATPPYPTKPQPLPQEDRRYAALLVTAAMVVPAAVCLLINFAYPQGGLWSLYPVGALLMLWVFIAPALALGRRWLPLVLAAGTISVLAYLALINLLSDGHWFMPLGLPLGLIFAAAGFIWLALIRLARVRGWLAASALCALLATAVVGVEIILDLFIHGAVALTWSLIVYASLMSLGVFFFLIRHNRQLRRRMHL